MSLGIKDWPSLVCVDLQGMVVKWKIPIIRPWNKRQKQQTWIKEAIHTLLEFSHPVVELTHFKILKFTVEYLHASPMVDS